MFSLSRLLIGLGMTLAGVAGVKYTFQVMNFTGRQDWLERYTGSGSTYGMYKLFSVLLIILGMLTATGFGNNVLEFILSPVKGVFQLPQ